MKRKTNKVSSEGKYNPFKDINFWIALIVGLSMTILLMLLTMLVTSPSMSLSILMNSLHLTLLPGFILTAVWVAWVVFKKGGRGSLVTGFIIGLVFAIIAFFVSMQWEMKKIEVRVEKQFEENSDWIKRDKERQKQRQEKGAMEKMPNKTFNCEERGMYRSEELGIIFQCPKGWSIEEDLSVGRIYISNVQGSFDKGNVPKGYQRIWISTWEKEASEKIEEETKTGFPRCCDARDVNGNFTGEAGHVIKSSVISGDLRIRTYEFSGGAGLKIQAFWENESGKMYFATNSVLGGEEGSEMVIKSLKDIISTIEFAK